VREPREDRSPGPVGERAERVIEPPISNHLVTIIAGAVPMSRAGPTAGQTCGRCRARIPAAPLSLRVDHELSAAGAQVIERVDGQRLPVEHTSAGVGEEDDDDRSLDAPLLEPGRNMDQQVVNQTPDRRKHSTRRRVDQVENILRAGPLRQDSVDKPLFQRRGNHLFRQ
jgi:hypothetical protein